jgi:hypothetical protein
MFSSSKVKRRQKFVWGLPDRVCRLNPKSKKKYQNTKSTNQNKKFPKKNYVSYLKSVKAPKICMRATRRNLQTQPKTLKKLSEHQIYQSEQKCPQKNYVSYLKSVKEPKIRMGATRRSLQA